MKEQDLNHKYDNEQVNRAVEYVQHIKYNKYEEYIRHQMSEMAAIKELESAEEKGRIEGEKVGQEKGVMKGRVEEKQATAIEMIKANSSIDFIHKITKLPISTIEMIKKEILND